MHGRGRGGCRGRGRSQRPRGSAAWLLVSGALTLATVGCAASGTLEATSGTTGATGVAGPTAELVAVPTDAWRGRVTRISDGDTLWAEVLDAVDGGPPVGTDVKLRLLRIDTPELGRDGAGPECLAEAAAQHLAELTPVGSEILAAYDVEVQDRFGRDLVHLWTADGVWVNGRMLADGYAQVVTFPPNQAYTDEVREAERSAREAGRGLWDDDAC